MEEIKKEISNLWEKKCMSIPGPQLHIALKRCRVSLARWKSKTATNSAKKIEELKNLLEKAGGILEIKKPYLVVESWRQKHQILSYGAKQRRCFNRITTIYDNSGKMWNTEERINTTF
ncbi:hypothetical protein HID58_087492, partial [Brassica napus]